MTELQSTPDSPKKRCSKCGVEYPATLEYFYAQKGGKYGLHSQCKTCLKARRNTEEFRAKRRAYDYNYYHNTPGRKEHVLELMKTAKYRERQIIHHREYYQRPEAKAKNAAKHRRYNENPDFRAKQKAIHERWSKTPRGKLIQKAHSHRRRALKMASTGQYTAADVQLQIKAQTDKKGRLHCWWCGKVIPKDETYHIDHRIPLIKGGSNGPENIVISHGKCNNQKRAKTPAEFMGRLF